MHPRHYAPLLPVHISEVRVQEIYCAFVLLKGVEVCNKLLLLPFKNISSNIVLLYIEVRKCLGIFRIPWNDI